MAIKVGINGFGRIGRLALRVAWNWPEFEFVHINDPGGEAAVFAHLLAFDSVHGRWDRDIGHADHCFVIDGRRISFSGGSTPADNDWSDCDLVIESSGHIKTEAVLQQYLEQGVGRVVVSAPVKGPGILNIVLGVNEQCFDPRRHRIVTAASCTTNCLAPVVKVIHENLRIRHGSMTTIHSLTTSQSILDQPRQELRRARACGLSLIPTTTGSATAIADIFPELKGRLNGHAVRVPLLNASLMDCVFEVEQATDANGVNSLFRRASESELKGILGYEERPLVSIDYCGDPRSAVVDALSTLVINKTHVKVYAWYDNEWGYANRLAELALKIGRGASG